MSEDQYNIESMDGRYEASVLVKETPAYNYQAIFVPVSESMTNSGDTGLTNMTGRNKYTFSPAITVNSIEYQQFGGSMSETNDSGYTFNVLAFFIDRYNKTFVIGGMYDENYAIPEELTFHVYNQNQFLPSTELTMSIGNLTKNDSMHGFYYYKKYDSDTDPEYSSLKSIMQDAIDEGDVNIVVEVNVV